MKGKILSDFPDVNVLIALVDPSHVHHGAARKWFLEASRRGYCTSPTTENGFVRVVSSPSYPGNRTDTPGQALDILQRLISRYKDHHLLPEQISLRDPALFEASHLLGHRQITDIYLLGLACSLDVRLVTFDKRIPTTAVKSFSDKNLLVLVVQ